MLKRISNVLFTSFKYFCVVHCITEHVGDVFLVSNFLYNNTEILVNTPF